MLQIHVKRSIVRRTRNDDTAEVTAANLALDQELFSELNATSARQKHRKYLTDYDLVSTYPLLEYWQVKVWRLRRVRKKLKEALEKNTALAQRCQ